MSDEFDFELSGDRPAYRQITDMLRERIVTGGLPIGTRFPPIGKLAKKWKTNYFTVQNALVPLTNEGLVESSPRNGTYVRSVKITCTAVGLYFGTQFWRSFSDGFYSMLFGILSEKLDEQGIKTHLWIDHRPAAEQGTPLPAMAKAVDRREIQGIIATMVTAREVEWLEQLSTPLALAWGWSEGNPATVTNDLRQMIAVSVSRLKEQGCRDIALIANEAELGKIFRREAARVKLTVGPHRVLLTDRGVSESAGSTIFSTMWAEKSRPDGLLVFPDVMARGVMVAALSERVRIPQDLKVIFHANAEMAFYCPLPVEWVVTRATRLAEALISSIQNQVAGSPPKPDLLPLQLLSGDELASLSPQGR